MQAERKLSHHRFDLPEDTCTTTNKAMKQLAHDSCDNVNQFAVLLRC
jgi:hypothetical protein